MTDSAIFLESERVILRQWKDSDLEHWVALNADAEVMKYFRSTLSREESIAMATRIRASIDAQGWGLWALQIKGGSDFAGFVGLSKQNLDLPFMPCVEIGWRLSKEHWGQGFATEAALLALAFGRKKFETIYSFTAAINTPSRRVMEKIGLLERSSLAFLHPSVPAGPIQAHVVYST